MMRYEYLQAAAALQSQSKHILSRQGEDDDVDPLFVALARRCVNQSAQTWQAELARRNREAVSKQIRAMYCDGEARSVYYYLPGRRRGSLACKVCITSHFLSQFSHCSTGRSLC